MLSFIENPTRHLFFTGKGGVGKTSLAAASAVALADTGRRVLLVSTDPASNLGQVLGIDVSDEAATPVPGVDNLWTLNIDPEAAAAAYRERVVGPVRGVLPEDAVRGMEEQLSGACTTEIAAFDQFTLLLTEPGRVGSFDHVIFDTAPTGHTLRLLQLPSAWSGFIAENPEGASCLGPMSGLEAQRRQYTAAVATLNDALQTTLVLVARPDRPALQEAARASEELSALGIAGQRLVVNGMFVALDPADPLAAAMERRAADALAAIPPALETLPREEVYLQPYNLVGIESLRSFLRDRATRPAHWESAAARPDLPSLGPLVDGLEAAGHGLVMVMGKGGVGKTTVAAAVAVELAARGHAVHLTTTDPAAHIAAAIDGVVDGLTVSRIDPREETRRYTEHVLATKGRDLDADARALLAEDLLSPCSEEVAVFHAFSRVVREAARGFVVVDTAPTGHTLLLLDATGAYHREVMRTTGTTPGRVTTPLMRLQDPEYARLLLVTLAETTPVLEAAALQSDLRRAGIEPYAWVVNQSLAAAGPADPLLAARAAAEASQIEAIQATHAERVFLVPYVADAPVGPERLRALVQGATVAA